MALLLVTAPVRPLGEDVTARNVTAAAAQDATWGVEEPRRTRLRLCDREREYVSAECGDG
jgi:hypothetical protein